jgi:hypothetical protein
MCLGKHSCSELGQIAEWSRLAPLPPPAWMWAHVQRLGDAIRAAAVDDRNKALSILRDVESDALRRWGKEHGQVSGIIRSRLTGSAAATVDVRPSRGISARLRAAIHRRDGYHCRYCGMPVIVRPAIQAFAAYVGDAAFNFGSTLESRHGAALLAVAQVDHVVPYNCGGTVDESNLVTACWSCNYGKDRFTLEQLNIDDPRSRAPVVSEWDGLASAVEPLTRRRS